MEQDIEALARPDVRAGLSFTRLVRLYLDPFALFKNVTSGPARSQAEAMQYNRRHRHILLAYLRRWTAIAIFCLTGGMPLAGAVYFLLGVEDPR